MDETPGYAESLRELEEILAEIEADDVDIDVLATKVSRAAELLEICRQRIDGARLQVERVVDGLDTESDG
jgi:exodeoxyribonuclease VII small subunit